MILSREQIAALYALRKAGERFELGSLVHSDDLLVGVVGTDKVWTVSVDGKSVRLPLVPR